GRRGRGPARAGGARAGACTGRGGGPGGDEPRDEIDGRRLGLLNFFADTEWVVRQVERTTGVVPPVAPGVECAGVGPRTDEEAAPENPTRAREVRDVVLVDHDGGARAVVVRQADGPASPCVHVVVGDREPIHTAEDPDVSTGGRRAVRNAVIVNNRLIHVEEKNGPTVHVEGVRRGLDVRDGRSYVTEVDARTGVPLECVLLDEEVCAGNPGVDVPADVLVRVDARAARGARVVVILE